jgi:hypothetical protein
MFPAVNRNGRSCFQALKLFNNLQLLFLILFFFFSLFVAHAADALLAGVSNGLQNILQVFQGVPLEMATVDIIDTHFLQYSEDRPVFLLIGLYELFLVHRAPQDVRFPQPVAQMMGRLVGVIKIDLDTTYYYRQA